MGDIPKSLPEGLERYSRTPEFTPASLPEKLTAFHSTKAGVWGVINVLEGAVSYRLEPPHDAEVIATQGETIIIEPTIAHRVAFETPGRFFVEFFRQAK